MEKVLLIFIRDQYNLIGLDKIEHGEQRASMNPGRHEFNHESPLNGWMNDAFAEEYPEPPKA